LASLALPLELALCALFGLETAVAPSGAAGAAPGSIN
jgi:hypothetical protein